MSDARSLSFQRQCVEHLIALCPDVSETILAGAKQGCLSIGYFERRSELLRLLAKLERDHPDLTAAMKNIADTFPGVEISDVRDLHHATGHQCRGDRTEDSPHDDGA